MNTITIKNLSRLDNIGVLVRVTMYMYGERELSMTDLAGNKQIDIVEEENMTYVVKDAKE